MRDEAGCCDDHVITDRLEIIDGFAVDLSVGDGAREVLRRRRPASFQQRDKVGLKFAEETKQLPGMPSRITAPGFTMPEVHILTCE